MSYLVRCTTARCKMCREWFCEETLVQCETLTTDISDEQLTLETYDWYYDEDSGVVLCPDCYREVREAGYDGWGYEYYLEDKGLKAS